MSKLDPGQALNLARQAMRAGQLAQAERWYREVLEQAPRQQEALLLLPELAKQRGDLEAAIAWYRLAAERLPAEAWPHNDMGLLLDAMGSLPEAIASFQRALATTPDSPAPLTNLGSTLAKAGRDREAEECHRQAIALKPDLAIPHSNLGHCLEAQGRKREALAAFRRAVELSPQDAEFHWNYALMLLVMGDFKKGWDEFEWRLKFRTALRRDFSQPQWKGEDLQGKTVLAHGEGGFGDTLQWVRLLPLLRDRGASVCLECQQGLERLMQASAEQLAVDRVLVRGESLPRFDFHVPLPSLPGALKVGSEPLPPPAGHVPYLQVPGEARRKWAGRIVGKGPKVGLVWAGSSPAVQQRRSTSLAIFAPLAALECVKFYSLQVGSEAAQKRPPGLVVEDLSRELTDFADTAAALEQLDLLITVDTSAAHLAGALGRPVWVLVPTMNDFRWFAERTDSPWYPTMRLWRQAYQEQWVDVVQRVASALSLE